MDEAKMFANLLHEVEALRRFRDNVVTAVGALEDELSRREPEPGRRSESVHPEPVAEPAVPPEVLVRRSPGPRAEVFHNAAEPCRRVTGEGRQPENFKPMLRTLAEAKSLRPCTACWPRNTWGEG